MTIQQTTKSFSTLTLLVILSSCMERKAKTAMVNLLDERVLLGK